MKILHIILNKLKPQKFYIQLLLILTLVGCTTKSNHSVENLSEFFLGIPANSNYIEVKEYIEKLNANSIIDGYEAKDYIEIIYADSLDGGNSVSNSNNAPVYLTTVYSNLLKDLEMVGIDSINSQSLSIHAELILNNDGKMETVKVIPELYFYNEKLLAVEIKKTALFSSIDLKSLLNTYKEKYGEPLYTDKITTTVNEKRNINGINYSFLDNHETYINWKEKFYTEETLWSYSNAYVKLVNLYHTDVKVNISKDSYEKAEEIFGKKYGFWDESYLEWFLKECTILNIERNKKNETAVYYINKTILEEAHNDVQKRKNAIQKVVIAKQKEKEKADSLINVENRKKYINQKI